MNEDKDKRKIIEDIINEELSKISNFNSHEEQIESYYPKIKRRFRPLPYDDSLNLAINLAKITNKEYEKYLLKTTPQGEINKFIIDVYNDLSCYDELLYIALNVLKVPLKQTDIPLDEQETRYDY